MAFAIFEGGDGTGKSSLSEKVALELRRRSGVDQAVQLIHCGPPQRDVLDEYALDVEGYRPGSGMSIVADRWHLGTLVYAQLYRDLGPYGELGVAGFRWVEMYLAARGAVAWVVDQEYELVKRRLEIRGEDYLEARHVEWVLERFRDVAAESMLTLSTMSPPEGAQTELVQKCIDTAQAAERVAAKLANFPGYVGSPRPHALLVGDRRGGDGPWRTEAPFMPIPSGSGNYLLNALPEDVWRGVGVINANESDVPAFLDALGYTPKIVALGRDASDTLLDHDIAHAGVPHPQYARRFAAKKRDEYGLLIKEAIDTGKVAFGWPR